MSRDPWDQVFAATDKMLEGIPDLLLQIPNHRRPIDERAIALGWDAEVAEAMTAESAIYSALWTEGKGDKVRTTFAALRQALDKGAKAPPIWARNRALELFREFLES